MKIVNLSDPKGNIKKKYVGYSFAFLFTGPLYLLINIKIISAILLFIFYYYLLPLPGMEYIVSALSSIVKPSFIPYIEKVFLFFRGTYVRYIGIGIVVLLQIVFSYFAEGYVLRKFIKKGKYLPVTEDDARLLISVHACGRKVALASSRFAKFASTKKAFKDVPYILNEQDNSEIAAFKRSEQRHKLEELNELYRLESMTREEYELRRAEIVKKYK